MRSVTGLPILNAAQRQSFDALLSPLPTVSLEQVNQRARMMSRMDRKYVLSSDQCAGILAQLPDETPVMSIGGALSQRYESVYFDTCGLDSYLSAAYGRRKRFKLRTRNYLDSGLSFVEFKHKGPRGLTAKTRVSTKFHTGVPDALPQADWAAAQLQRVGVDAAVSPTLHGGYRRCCLLTNNGRATIDSGLFWIGLRSYSDSTVSTSDAECPRLDAPEMVIIETKSGAQPGAIDRLLWRNGIRPCRISKYATGMAAVYPHLPSNRWHSTLTHHFDLPAAA